MSIRIFWLSMMIGQFLLKVQFECREKCIILAVERDQLER